MTRFDWNWNSRWRGLTVDNRNWNWRWQGLTEIGIQDDEVWLDNRNWNSRWQRLTVDNRNWNSRWQGLTEIDEVWLKLEFKMTKFDCR